MREEREAKNKLNLEKARIRAEQSAALAYAAPPVEQSGYRSNYPIYGFPRHHLNQQGSRFQDERHSAFRRGPHHVQAGHGRISYRSHNRAGSNNFRGAIEDRATAVLALVSGSRSTNFPPAVP